MLLDVCAVLVELDFKFLVGVLLEVDTLAQIIFQLASSLALGVPSLLELVKGTLVIHLQLAQDGVLLLNLLQGLESLGLELIYLLLVACEHDLRPLLLCSLFRVN